jgi:DNA-binding transcriptional ArsR family regulator
LVKTIIDCVVPLQVIQSPEVASVLLKPERLKMLELLREPDSATGIGRKMNLARQSVNYHLRDLEKHGLIRFVENRTKGNCVERVLQATARSYVVSPAALDRLGQDPETLRDRFSSAYLVRAAGGAINEVTRARERAGEAGKQIATLTLEADIRFRSAEERASFAEELTASIAALVAKYHSDSAANGRTFRLLLGSYPKLSEPAGPAAATVNLE